MIYRLRYCNKDGVEARVDIQKGLSTPVIEVEGTERPFILSYNNDKGNKSGMFLTSSADIEIYETEDFNIDDFNIDNLKTSNETELPVTYYINDVVKWKGFIIPDFFSIEVRNNPVIVMTASDRLGTLKSVTLSDLPSMISLRELAVLCLNKTGLTLPLKTMADFSNGSGINDFFNSKILTQRLSDTKGRSISCYDILSSILTASNSKLLQRGGEWIIINKVQHEAGSGKLFSSATSFINWSDVIFNFSDISIGGRRTIIPVASTVGVYHEHGGGRLHPGNYDFSKGLTGWSTVGDFSASIDNRQIDGFQTQGGQAGYFPIYGAETENSYLVNYNQYERNVNPKYLESEEITIPYNGSGAIEVEVDVNATGPLTYPGSSFAPATLRISVVAVSGTETLTLDHSGKFIPMPSTNPPIFSKDFGKALPVNDVYKADSIGMKVKGTLEVGSLENYKLKVRIYGGTGGRTILVNMVSLSMKNTQEIPKGTIFKTERGSNFTKEHEIETTVFGDYITSGLNGYFYSYPIDDTSSLYDSSNELTSKWTAYNDTDELPLLQHVTRQKSRLFSVAHDLLSAEIEVSDFDPLAIFVACGKRYTVVSAQFDFFKSNLSVELEEVAFQNANVRDFIYSYFGDGESGIKNIGGISGGGGGGGTGGGLTPEQINMLADVSYLAHTHENKTEIDKIDAVVNSTDNTVLSDDNILTSLRVIEEILKNNETIKDLFLSKVDPDTAQEIIKFVKGIEIGNFTTGPLGAGASLKMENGVSRMEVDQLDVRMRATFRELIIESLKHIGGQLILSPARMKCTSVVDGGTYYRCYFDTGDGKVSNEFVAGDQARCQVFTGSGVKMYWRLVTSVGADWINLSKTDAISGSSIPEAGDDIVQLGHRTDTTRQNAQILSTVGSDAPSWKQYKGINAFSLEGKDTTVFSGTGNKIDGKTVFMSSGANVEDGINSKNSNYSSQPTSYKANDTWTLSADQTVNGVAYKSGEILTATQDSTTFVQSHWVKKVRYTDDTAVNNLEIGGRNLIIKSATTKGYYNSLGDFISYPDAWISDFIEVSEGKEYTAKSFNSTNNVGGRLIYFDADKTYITRGEIVAEETFVIPTGVGYIRYQSDKVGGVYVDDAIIVKGNKATDWTPAPEDVQAAIDAVNTTAADAQAKANTAKAVTDKFGTTTEGGLISTVITEYRELNSEQVTGLISGIQGANKNLPFLVAGGTYAEGIAGTAKVIIRHDGTGKIGTLDISANGRVSTGNGFEIDETGKLKATGGEIGSFAITASSLESASGNNSMLLSSNLVRFLGQNSSVFIGADTFPSSNGGAILGTQRIDVNRTITGMINGNVGIYINVRGSRSYDDIGYQYTGNHAIYAIEGDYAGFRMRTRRIATSQTLSDMDNVILAVNNSSNITITLPYSPKEGQIYFISSIGNANYTLRVGDINRQVLEKTRSERATSYTWTSTRDRLLIVIWDKTNNLWKLGQTGAW